MTRLSCICYIMVIYRGHFGFCNHFAGNMKARETDYCLAPPVWPVTFTPIGYEYEIRCLKQRCLKRNNNNNFINAWWF